MQKPWMSDSPGNPQSCFLPLLNVGKLTSILKTPALNLALLFPSHGRETVPKPEVILISGEVKKPSAPIKMCFKSFCAIMAAV